MKIKFTTISFTGRNTTIYAQLIGLAGCTPACPSYGREFDSHSCQKLLYAKLLHII